MRTPDEDRERELEKLDQRATKDGLSEMRLGPLRWLAGAILAVAAAALVVLILELNRPDPAKAPPPPSKPVVIQIVPGEKK